MPPVEKYRALLSTLPVADERGIPYPLVLIPSPVILALIEKCDGEGKDLLLGLYEDARQQLEGMSQELRDVLHGKSLAAPGVTFVK